MKTFADTYFRREANWSRRPRKARFRERDGQDRKHVQEHPGHFESCWQLFESYIGSPHLSGERTDYAGINEVFARVHLRLKIIN